MRYGVGLIREAPLTSPSDESGTKPQCSNNKRGLTYLFLISSIPTKVNNVTHAPREDDTISVAMGINPVTYFSRSICMYNGNPTLPITEYYYLRALCDSYRKRVSSPRLNW